MRPRALLGLALLALALAAGTWLSTRPRAAAPHADAAPEGVDIVPVWENWIEQANGKTDFPQELAEELLGGLGM